MMKRFTIVCFLSCLALTALSAENSLVQRKMEEGTENVSSGTSALVLPYMDASSSVEIRVEDLLGRMTLAEKVAQVSSVSLRDATTQEGGIATAANALLEQLSDGIGQIENTFDLREPKKSVEDINELQRYLVEKTRLGIPALVGSECLHGLAARNSTVLPVPLAMASSWNPDLVNEAFLVVGKEARMRGATEAHTPVLDLGRDPRWGRIEETFGEDTYLVTQMGKAVTSGLQGGCDGNPGLEHIIASPKHFAGYGQVAGGRNFAATEMDTRTLYDDVMPPFQAVIQEVGVQGIMATHCDVEGVPAHGNHWLLTEYLRGELGFEGYVVSDYNDVPRLSFFQNVVETIEDAAAQGIYAGVDMDLPVGQAYAKLLQVMKARPELLTSLDASVRRVLRLKFMLGLFEHPYGDPEFAAEHVASEAHVDLAEALACESIVLLKNENNLLPLDRKEIGSVAVLGPNAAVEAIGNYTVENDHVVSILEGIKAYVGQEVDVLFEEGCSIPHLGWENKQTVLIETPRSEEMDVIERAVSLAKKADVAVVCVGGTVETAREAYFVDGIKGDRATLGLLGNQQELVMKVLETGTPTVVVFMSGRPLSTPEIAKQSDAILNTFYLGQTNGNAVAKVLFGDVNPSGKLPVTVARSVGQLPVYYSQKEISFYKDYLDEEPGPLYPFGYGLSYTTFDYSNLKLQKDVWGMNDTVRFSVKVKNTGDRAGAEIVQVYFRDLVATVTRPAKKLVRFAKIWLEPGEVKELTFDLNPSVDLSFTGTHGKKIVEPGEFELYVGRSSADIVETAKFRLK